MVELQLEKLSPLPVTHIVWSLYLMPRAGRQARRVANGHCHHCRPRLRGGISGRIWSQGFLADRIECPGLDQLLSAKMNEDGLWIFPGRQGEPALIAWHYGGAIQNLTLLPCRKARNAARCSRPTSSKSPGRANWKAG